MDVLKRTLLIAFYILIVLVGIAGFLAIRSLRGDARHGDARHGDARHATSVGGNARHVQSDTVKVEDIVVKP